MTKTPKKLSREAGAWWRKLCNQWAFDDSQLLLLESALSSFDRMRQAQMELEKDGITCLDRFEQVKPHPACTIERDSKAAMSRDLRALNLDVEIPGDRQEA